MPICISCTHSALYLYTVYESENNLRLEKCPNPDCDQFVDPYVEHDSLTILLDLILLKRGVYRHLLYNRGSEPRRLTENKKNIESNSAASAANDVAHAQNERHKKEVDRWLLLIRLGTALIFVDAVIRSSYLYADKDKMPETTRQEIRWTRETLVTFLRVFLGTAAETIAFHGGITLTCYFFMKLSDVLKVWYPPKTVSNSSIRQEFRLSLISFSLLYSSITKLFLLFLLTIWLPTSPQSLAPVDNPLPNWAKFLARNNSDDFIANTMRVLDDDQLDREWIVRNILGGMSAGFGLRVILDIPPILTTFLILAGWMAKTAVATMLSGWVGGSQRNGEAWLAYSIP